MIGLLSKRIGCALIAFSGLLALGANADQVTVAVATNFASPMNELETLFETTTGHEVTSVPGSTGQLYAQILNGAPYDVFVAADQERPGRLVVAALAVEGTRFTYALGQLILWTREPSLASDLSLDVFAGGEFRRVAIANPRLAPYGVAAREALEAMGLWESLQTKIVRGENVGQAFAMVETRNAELGLVALSNAVAYSGFAGSATIPPEYYAPIRQDAILLTRGQKNAGALAFIAFLQSAAARQIISEAGYALP